MSERDVPAGPGGCHAALLIVGDHFWCEMKAPHLGWPHASGPGQAVWRGEGAAEDPAVAWAEVDPEAAR